MENPKSLEEGRRLGESPTVSQDSIRSLIATRKTKVRGEEEIPTSRLLSFSEAEILCQIQEGISMKRDPKERFFP